MAGWSGGWTHGRSGGAARDAADGDGVAAAVGGEGLATGDDTLTTGDATLKLNDRGPITVVTGNATVQSAAESHDGGQQPSAYADTYANVSGADFVFIFSTDASGRGSGESGSWESATSTTRLFAVDFEGFDLPGGQQTLQIDLVRGGGAPHLSFGGNFSTADASSDAVGDSSYTLASTETFTTDDSSGVAVDAYGFIA